MIDGGGEAGFAKLRGAHLLGGEIAALEELDDDGPLQEGVGREKDDARAAGTDLTDKLILLDNATLHEAIISGAR